MVVEESRMVYLEKELSNCLNELNAVSNRLNLLHNYLEQKFGSDFLDYSAKNLSNKQTIEEYELKQSQQTQPQSSWSGDLSNWEPVTEEPDEECCVEPELKFNPEIIKQEQVLELEIKQELDLEQFLEIPNCSGNEELAEEISTDILSTTNQVHDACYFQLLKVGRSVLNAAVARKSTSRVKKNLIDPLSYVPSSPKLKKEKSPAELSTNSKKLLHLDNSESETFQSKESGSDDEELPKTKRTKTSRNINQYRKYCQRHPKNVYECLVCNAMLKSGYASFRRHYLSVHTKIKIFVCLICNEKFSRKDNLLRHTRLLHDHEPKERTFGKPREEKSDTEDSDSN